MNRITGAKIGSGELSRVRCEQKIAYLEIFVAVKKLFKIATI